MISDPQGEGVSRQLEGIEYRVNGATISVGGHRLEVSPYLEQCRQRESEHVCGVRFEIHLDEEKDTRLTYGLVANAKTREAALRQAVHDWWVGFAVPVIRSLAVQEIDFTASPYFAFSGAMAVRGDLPGGWPGPAEMQRQIAPALGSFLQQRSGVKSIDLRVLVEPDGVKDLGCRADGRLSGELFQAVAVLPWPKTATKYIFYQAYILRHQGEGAASR